MKSHIPTSDERQWMNAITQIGCIVCRVFRGCETPAMVHHISGKVKKGSHKLTIPLCFYHHSAGVMCDEFVSRHPHKAEFESRYGTEYELLEKTRQLVAAQ